ncbi:hypothetical protein EYF80_065095 [Liparis tanakae]|uniref:Uncharacterized protein n=1 Tax=Liparis tanakae TaxID=230148 RepID=A0A4Z2E7L2_9TELE|nr:hypothetical protein EYF80_065095 [Liparis tanakae]
MCEGRKITSWVASLLTPLVSVGGGPEGRGPEGLKAGPSSGLKGDRCLPETDTDR